MILTVDDHGYHFFDSKIEPNARLLAFYKNLADSLARIAKGERVHKNELEAVRAGLSVILLSDR